MVNLCAFSSVTWEKQKKAICYSACRDAYQWLIFGAELKRQPCGLAKILPGVGDRMLGGVFIIQKGFLQAAALST